MKREKKAIERRLSSSTTQLVVYVGMLFFASCEIPVIELPVMPNSVPPEIIKPIEEIKMVIKPIDEYQNYVVNNGNVKGILGKELIPVDLRDEEGKEYQFRDFFTKNGKVFFSTVVMENGTEAIPESDPIAYVQIPVTYYYVQTGDSVEETEEGLYPLVPESDFITMDSPPYKIETFDFDGGSASKVFKSTLEEGYLQIDNFSMVYDGLYFSVSIGTKGREAGVHYWDSNSQGTIKKCDGRIW